MTFFIEEPSKILAWLNAKGYSGTLNDAFDAYLRSGSSMLGGTSYDQIMFRLGGDGTLNDRLTTMFQSKTGLSNRKDAERKFFQDSSLDMFAATYTSQYPSPIDGTTVKATTNYATDYLPEFACNPAKSLTGADIQNGWAGPGATNQRFHIDLGSAKTITRIYYENYHNSGGSTNSGAKTLIVQGSNNAAAFADLTYATDTNWTAITASGNFLQHTAADVADPKYITLTNAVAYRYYALKFADTWGGAYMGVRRIELQS